jgi:hypothetical protein
MIHQWSQWFFLGLQSHRILATRHGSQTRIYSLLRLRLTNTDRPPGTFRVAPERVHH